MFKFACASAFAIVCFSQSVFGQTIFPIGFQGNSLSGSAVGTDVDGQTTYVLEGVSSTVPITVTLVEGPSAISEFAEIPALSFTVQATCAKLGNTVVCEDIIQADSTTITASQTVPYAPIVLGTGGIAPTTTASLLPPSIPVTPPPSPSPLPSTQTPSASRPTTTGSSNGAVQRNVGSVGVVVIGMLSAVLLY